jgi:phosphatidylglycerophosphate synthase
MDLRYPLTRYVYRPLSVPVATRLAKTAITPVQVTLLSAVFAGAGGVAVGFGYYRLGVLLTVVGAITDCVDGDLARISGATSRAGAYLDSVLDRWTDAALIVGLGFSDPDRYGAAAAFALVGSFLVSYARSRAQALGVDAQQGIAGRDARMLILMVTTLFGFIAFGLWLVAVLGIITTIHRMVVAIRALDHYDRDAA